MPSLVIRDIPEEVMRALNALAMQDGMRREPWLRQELTALVERRHALIPIGKRAISISTIRRQAPLIPEDEQDKMFTDVI
jgi:hypothetical protein